MKNLLLCAIYLFCSAVFASSISTGGGVWGSIIGTLSSQSDLQSVLDGKVSGSGTANRLAYFNGSTSLASGILGIDTDYLYVYNSADASRYSTISRSSGLTSIQAYGAGGTNLEFRTASGSNLVEIDGSSSLGVPWVSLVGYNPSHASLPSMSLIGNALDFYLVATRRGRGVGNATSKLNALTVSADANVDIAGTTSVNASTTVTGTSTSFLNDLGIGDDISVNGGTTWARVTAIASNTSLTVDTAIGSGGSQTITKRQAGLRLQQNDGTFLAEFDNGGKQGCRSGVTCGTATCNGSTEVTVTTAAVKTNTIVLLTQQSPGGTPSGTVRVSSRSSGTSFGFICAALDTSTVGWYLIEPR